MKTLAQLWRKVEKTNGCWFWTGAKTRDGYGRLSWCGRLESAHVVVYAQVHGKWPEFYVLHLCDTPACVRPDHLTEADQEENLRQAIERGRIRPKLSLDQVKDIRTRLLLGEKESDLAREPGVTRATFSCIARGKTGRLVGAGWTPPPRP